MKVGDRVRVACKDGSAWNNHEMDIFIGQTGVISYISSAITRNVITFDDPGIQQIQEMHKPTRQKGWHFHEDSLELLCDI